jgi:hypothetical protein
MKSDQLISSLIWLIAIPFIFIFLMWLYGVVA